MSTTTTTTTTTTTLPTDTVLQSKPGRLAVKEGEYEGLDAEWRNLWNEHGSSMVRADEVTIEEYRLDPARYTFAYATCSGMHGQGNKGHSQLIDVLALGPDVFHVEDRQIPVSQPSGEITVRIYSPEGPGPFPVHLNIHGGIPALISIPSK